MTALTWDGSGKRFFETGIDHGVLYPRDSTTGTYPLGVAWNGLTTVTEKPSGAEASAQYADNIKYLNLFSAEEISGTIEAFTFPDEFSACDGTASPVKGLTIAQQTRQQFGLVYRTLLGNDIEGQDFGYKLHLIYGAQASPSEKAYATVNDSPSPISFSWDFSTTPISPGSSLKPTALLVVDSTVVDPTRLTALEKALFGASETTDKPRLPLPSEVITILTGGA